ncbi:uncharacterized protein LOC120345439 [Styela clava]|uniref:KH domain-containing, RNA-binding, signal transduction-associated protein 2-like n=1 Tax=Styela clava TaxID=7725 RepID=UPI00193994A1|nr:KH domain-containing, RNA-binding, signal transduction-associated protein 2-like [Styela clava]
MEQADSKYLPELMAEKDNIDSSYIHALRLMKEEIERIKNPLKSQSKDSAKTLIDVDTGNMQKVEIDIKVPTEKHPRINFVGRLIGPGGSTMKGIQEVTGTKIAVLGKGSVRERDRKKAEELHAQNDPKYAHLAYPLHVHISAYAPLPQAYISIGRACAEIQKLLVIDEQAEGQQYEGGQGMNTGMRSGRGAGGMGNSGGFRGGRGGTRGGGPRGGARGSGMRGGGASRGATGSRGGMGGGQRGSARGASRGRGAGRGQSQAYAQLSQVADAYTDDYGYDSSYGAVSAVTASAYDTTGYEEYDATYDASYDAAAYGAEAVAYGDGYEAETGYEDYGYGTESFDAYGNGSSMVPSVKPSFGGGQGFRGKMRGGMRGRQKPY